jgi:hypothetical protein
MAEKKKTKKRKVTEIFEVTKKGKEKEVKKTGAESIPIKNPKQEGNQIKVIKSILIIGSLIILGIIAGVVYGDMSNNSNYKDIVKFEKSYDGALEFYVTNIPVMNKNIKTPYNFFLRTNPKDLEKIKFEDEDFALMKFVALNLKDDFECAGDHRQVALANLRNLYTVSGASFVFDSTATCEEEGRYTLFNLIEGSETKIEKIGKNCYNVEIADCEIIKATEKIMAEVILEYLKEGYIATI